MLNSPFPKLNPNVKYKTAFQRAGFDTNLGISDNSVLGNVLPPDKSNGLKMYNLQNGSAPGSPNSTFMNEDSSNSIQLINKSLQKKQKMLLRKQQEEEEKKNSQRKKKSNRQSPLGKKTAQNNAKLGKNASSLSLNSSSVTPSPLKVKNLPMESIHVKKNGVETFNPEFKLSNNSQLSINSQTNNLPQIQKRDISHVSNLVIPDESMNSALQKNLDFMSQDFIEFESNPEDELNETAPEQTEHKPYEKSINYDIDELSPPPINTLQNIADLQFEQESFYSEIQSQDPRHVSDFPQLKNEFIGNNSSYEENELKPITFSNEQHIPPSTLGRSELDFIEAHVSKESVSSDVVESTDKNGFATPAQTFVENLKTDINTDDEINYLDSEVVIADNHLENEINELDISKEQLDDRSFVSKYSTESPDNNGPLDEESAQNLASSEYLKEENGQTLVLADTVYQNVAGSIAENVVEKSSQDGDTYANEEDIDSHVIKTGSTANKDSNRDLELPHFYEEKHVPPEYLNIPSLPAATENMPKSNEFDSGMYQNHNNNLNHNNAEDYYTISNNEEPEDTITAEGKMTDIKEAIGNQNDIVENYNTCRQCKNEILKNEKKIYDKSGELSGKWHKSCFKCTLCLAKFSKKVPCYIHNDFPYCEDHFFEISGLVCFGCQEKILEDLCLDVPGLGKAHIGCFKCNGCDLPIDDEYFSNDTINLCSSCVQKKGESKMDRRRTVLWDAN
ncbi:hypothetical protein QEN19_004168 [Hanseniaspora menglaensis]